MSGTGIFIPCPGAAEVGLREVRVKPESCGTVQGQEGLRTPQAAPECERALGPCGATHPCPQEALAGWGAPAVPWELISRRCQEEAKTSPAERAGVRPVV